jgi:hypothetical protein
MHCQRIKLRRNEWDGILSRDISCGNVDAAAVLVGSPRPCLAEALAAIHWGTKWVK